MTYQERTRSILLLLLSVLIHPCLSQNQAVNEIAVGNHHKIKLGREGVFLINSKDSFVGRSLDVYGEWSETELFTFAKFIQPGSTVLDIGANIGAFTIPLAKLVGKDGIVHAFEPQLALSQLVSANVVLNELYNVIVHNVAVGSSTETLDVPKILYDSEANFGGVSLLEDWKATGGALYKVPQIVLDDMFGVNAICPSFMKIDVEGMELMVLKGATKILAECKPVLYVENNCVKDSEALITFIASHGYICHWDVHPYFNGQNFAGVQQSIFPDESYSINMICYPDGLDVSGVQEIQDITKIDVANGKFELSQYQLSMAGKEFILGQMGTKESCQR